MALPTDIFRLYSRLYRPPFSNNPMMVGTRTVTLAHRLRQLSEQLAPDKEKAPTE